VSGCGTELWISVWTQLGFWVCVACNVWVMRKGWN
jgi:hypothetical protein